MPPRLIRWTLAAMVAVGALAFLRAFTGGNAAAAQHLGWGGLAWTFPLLWDVLALIGSTLWIAAPRRTTARRWGVIFNLTAVVVSGLTLGAQDLSVARRLTDGWPAAAFLTGLAVPLIYSALTWAAASARTITEEPEPWTTLAPPTPPSDAVTVGYLQTLDRGSPSRPADSGPPTAGDTSPSGPSWATTTPPTPSPTTGPTTSPDASPDDAGEPDAASGTSSETSETPSGEPSSTSASPPTSTTDERREWALNLLRQGVPVTGGDVERQFGVTNGYRVATWARAQLAAERAERPIRAVQ